MQSLTSDFDMMPKPSQTVSLIRSGQHKIYATILTVLFISVVTHLVANWSLHRDIFILHNDTRNAMIQESLNPDGQPVVAMIANVAAFMAIWLGDALLVCILTH
jgi:hypothetical protein